MSEDRPNLIFKYTRQDAIDDGVLVDITPIAEMVGFHINFCINVSVYERFKDELVRLLADLGNRVMKAKPELPRYYYNYNGLDLVFDLGSDDEGDPCFTLCEPTDL